MKKRPDKLGSADKKDKTSALDPELDLFTREMADVVRLPSDPRGRVRAVRPISPPRASTPSCPSLASPDETDLEAGYVSPGVDRRELRKLKRGEHAATNRLDLHGETAAEAIASVKRFIDNSLHRHRSVCIVHGRGLHSQGSVSILKTRVREFLRNHWAVLAYADAPRADGGAGAVYVLLRK